MAKRILGQSKTRATKKLGKVNVKKVRLVKGKSSPTRVTSTYTDDNGDWAIIPVLLILFGLFCYAVNVFLPN